MRNSSDLLRYFQTDMDQSLDLLRVLVGNETYSRDEAAVSEFARLLAAEFTARGAETSILRPPAGADSLKAVWRAGGEDKPVLVLGHLDTVWPAGTIARRPFRVERGKAYGPGIFDMKGGILLSLLACGAFQSGRCHPGKDVVFFFTADEETGTKAGLSDLREIASGCRAALCLEPPLPGGKAKTSRKGVGNFKVRVEGIAAHPGTDHEKGASAILELCRLVIDLEKMTDYKKGITVNVGVVQGGLAANVIPAVAEAEVDMRVSGAAEGEQMQRRIRALQARDPRCCVTVEGGMICPPLERTPAVIELYQRARTEALDLGMDLGEGPTGGASDGSITAAMGIPTLDGLGVQGDGAHALHEYIEVADIPRRAALLCRLIRSL